MKILADTGHAGLPNEWFTKTVMMTIVSEPMSIHFAAIDDDAIVWVNGIEVGMHNGYNEPFACDMTKAMREGENSIVVRVADNSGSGGIVKPVTLIERRSLDALMKSPYASKRARPSADRVKNAIIYSVYLRSKFFALRKSHPALSRGSMETVPTSASEHVFACVRSQGSDQVITVMNFSSDPVKVDLTPPHMSMKKSSGNFREIFSGAILAYEKRMPMRISLPSRGYMIMAHDRRQLKSRMAFRTFSSVVHVENVRASKQPVHIR